MNESSESSVLTDEERTTAIGLARYAFDYIEAALLVDINHRNRYPRREILPIPAYFLIHHGIELTLKAYLRHNGVTVRDIGSKKYGHNLHSCYRKAKELGLLGIFTQSKTDLVGMRMLVNLNHHQGLRYIETGQKQFPTWSLIESLAVRLHQAVAPAVGYKTFTVSVKEIK